MNTILLNNVFRKTRRAIIGTALLNEPFVVFYALLPFILRKDLQATTFEIALLTMLKPAVSVFSFYWSAKMGKHSGKLKTNLVITGLLAYLPFLFYPFFQNRWYLIFASAIYMLFSKASIPAWIEILRINLPKGGRTRLFSWGSILGYTEGAAISFALGMLMDKTQRGWQILLLLGAAMGICGIILQWLTPLENSLSSQKHLSSPNIRYPLKNALALLRERPDFKAFQAGSFISGFGTMLSIPALALFFADFLKLSYMKMLTGRCVFMGLGFIVFSPVFALFLNNTSINKITGIIALGFALFPFVALFSGFYPLCFYLAFFIYGITQAGSHLVWNLSGSLFAKDEDSRTFSEVNVLMIGVRGLIAPLLGGVLCDLLGAYFTLILSSLICFYGFWYLKTTEKQTAIA